MIRALVIAAMLLQGTPDSALDARAREVASTLRCPACEDVSIEDSPADLARDMRRLVRQQLSEGKSPAQVRQYFVDRYGQWVLLDPAASRGMAPLWVLPLVAVGGAGVGLGLAIRKWSRAPRVAAASADDDLELDRLDGKISEEDFERLRKSDDSKRRART
jgi:cytochrome c-type biogenesis protein CcmH